MNLRYNKPLLLWLFSGAFLVFAMVVVGGITRLTHSGLSITEWNLIMGSIPPLNEMDWNAVFAKYQQTPEFQKINYSMTLSEFKFIFFWEFIHRLIGRLIGVVFLVPFVYFYFTGQLKGKFTRKLLFVFALGGLQGLIGWYMVKSGLVNDPHVSHYRLALHLITAFITFGYIWWLVLDIIAPRAFNKITSGRVRSFASIILGVVLVQIVYGAFVAGLKAGLVYNTWPMMGDEWVAEGTTAMKPLWVNFVEGLAGIQFIHRYIAYLVVGLIIYVWFKYRTEEKTVLQKRAINFLLGMVLLQFTLGVLTLVYAVPLVLGVLHQIGAFFLFASAIFFYHQTRVPKIHHAIEES